MIILLTIYVIEYFSENFIIKAVNKCFGRRDKLSQGIKILNNSIIEVNIDFEQKTYTKNKERMAKFTQVSYNPELNDTYAKILLAMQDVAIVKKDLDTDEISQNGQDLKLYKEKTSKIAYQEYKKKKELK